METTDLRTLVEDQLRLSRQLRARIRELEAERSAPLAVVGTALRFPGGVSTPEQYWELLTGPATGPRDIPADRPGLRAVHDPQAGPGRSYVDKAGFLADVAGFDPDFFGISQREAESLDPQQRLLLETSWEALERAGVAVRRTDRLDAGVFVGLMAAEYGDRFTTDDPDRLDPYFGTGGGHCFAAGRISYALGLRGPAVTLDTACSSSLVALHSAARSLRAGECRYALVGGANLIFSPRLMVSLCQSGALAPDGRSKPFTAAADGYGRGEGVATVVLMRLADAVADGRPVLAVVRGTAVNHDGAASGLTVPSGPAQQEVIRAALRDAAADPADVSYVEAHGTGTALGDPIEVAALDAVYGEPRPGSLPPLPVSSVKGRLGHLEAAAGLAGLIKLVLMLRHERIVVDVPESDGPLNPLIPWPDIRIEVPRRPAAWTGAGRMAGISAFGLSGTNAHVIVAAGDPVPAPEPPLVSGPSPTEGPPPAAGSSPARSELLVLSARSPAALHSLAASVGTQLFRSDPADLPSVCHTLRAGRAALPYRLAVTGATPRELARKVSLAVDAVAAPCGPAPRTVLIVDPAASSALAKGVAAIASDLPLCHVDSLTPELDPTAWLAGVLDQLGAPVATRTTPDARQPAELDLGGERTVLVPADPERATGAFLDALAVLFRAGAQLRMEPLRAPGARFVADLPTYPFQRRRCWVPEPVASVRAAGVAAERVVAGQAPVAGQAVPEAADRTAVEGFLHAELAEVLKANGTLDLRSTFAELGGDSFTAMLFLRRVQECYPSVPDTVDLVGDRPLSALIAELARDVAHRADGPGADRPGPQQPAVSQR
ncbi:type I polyketide synthase [Micromonospora sp. NBC_01813]|uniref:type I polyketide synthase n=1 Tax=Micromonospora sp. NBC_01813 TaxID=2975988 RepID=UPI002DD874E6|nr:beta-ketoacyl synthase N-terminal-like domain-containing protein [Micromonospora sp. NBC_01813]WSA08968.1 phosphopantetheine-binding protein [Micromonospora sp. NBC_01813]